MSGYLGSIGFGFPAAMGAWAAAPERPVVAVTGDGGFGQYLAELTTAVKYGMPITHVLLNNSQLGKISKEQRAGGLAVWQTSLHNPDFAAYAELCGAHGHPRHRARAARRRHDRALRRRRPHPALRRPGRRTPLKGTTMPNYDDLRALFINCTLKRSPELSNTAGPDRRQPRASWRSTASSVEVLRAVDHDIATGVWPDMTEHGWATDAWPAIYEQVLAADILVLAGPIWLGDNSSVTKQVIERLYACSHLLNDAGQYAYYGRVGGCLITGNEDGVKHCAMNVLYSLQHLGYTIPPQADAGWIGEAGPGPSYLDPGSGGPENDFTNRNTTFMTWNLMHLARMLKDAGGIPAYGNQRSEWDAGCRFDFENPEYR